MPRVVVHALTDGRDSRPDSALPAIRALEGRGATIGTVVGRGFFFLFAHAVRLPEWLQHALSFVPAVALAAILALIGYSNNETIVIFDRIRENQSVHRSMGLLEVMNKSLNETLSRTIITSGTVFLVTIILFLFGGEVNRGFGQKALVTWMILAGLCLGFGTEFVIEACSQLPVELDLVEGVPHEQARKRYAKADIIIDQLLVGWHGVFALEAMALGKPVITYLKPDVIEKSALDFRQFTFLLARISRSAKKTVNQR